MAILFPIIAIIGLLLLIAASILLIVLPTALNLYLTTRILRLIGKTSKSIIIMIPIFIAISFILAMNIRLFGVLSDMFSSQEQKEISQQKTIQLAYGTKVKLKNNIGIITYKKHPLDTPILAGDEGCMCTYYDNPTVVQEDITNALTYMGLIISDDADVVIDIKGKADDYLTNLTITITNKEDLIAEKDFRIRNKYLGDVDLNESGRQEDGSILQYLSQSTIWNVLLPYTGLIKEQDRLIMGFIKKSLDIRSARQEKITLQAEPIINITPISDYVIESDKYRDILWCDSNIVRNYSSLKVKNKDLIIPIEHELLISEKVICTEQDINIVSMSGIGNEYFQIDSFDYQGKHLENIKYTMPSVARDRYPKKALIYFNKDKNGIVIGIEEIEKGIESKLMYYFLPAKNSNKSKHLDSVNATDV